MATELLGEEGVTTVCGIGHTFGGYTMADAKSRMGTFTLRPVKLSHQLNIIYFKLNPLD
jgi:hypothetical protein